VTTSHDERALAADQEPSRPVVSVAAKEPLRSRSRLLDAVDRFGVYSWRLVGIGIVVLACLWLLRRTSAVVIPVVVALFIARVLAPVSC
jgi:hypothetical protein